MSFNVYTVLVEWLEFQAVLILRYPWRLLSKAFGAENVLGIMLPEKDSSGDSARFAQKLADKFGVKAITENITGALQGFDCYKRRDEAVKRVFPEYDPADYKMKIGVKSSGLYTNLPPFFQ